MEKMGLEFPKENGKFIRRPTRGLRVVKDLKPAGGGLEYCWRLRKALEEEGVQIVERIFITGLLKDEDSNVAGAVGVDGRTRDFVILRSKATIVATNSVSFRAGFVRDLTGTGTILAYKAGATLANAEFGYLRPGNPKFYFEGITFAVTGRTSSTNFPTVNPLQAVSGGGEDVFVAKIAQPGLEKKLVFKAESCFL